MLQEKRELLLMTAAALAVLVVFAVFAPRFLFREIRISNELDRLNHLLVTNVSDRISIGDSKIADYHGRWSYMYAKLELSAKDYEQIKQMLLKSSNTETNKDFSDDILREPSKYNYDPKSFTYLLRVMDNTKKRHGLASMNLNINAEEILIYERVYGKWFSSGSTIYALIKENESKHYLYIYAA